MACLGCYRSPDGAQLKQRGAGHASATSGSRHRLSITAPSILPSRTASSKLMRPAKSPGCVGLNISPPLAQRQSRQSIRIRSSPTGVLRRNDSFTFQHAANFLKFRADRTYREPNLAEAVNVREFLAAILKKDNCLVEAKATLEETELVDYVHPRLHFAAGL